MAASVAPLDDPPRLRAPPGPHAARRPAPDALRRTRARAAGGFPAGPGHAASGLRQMVPGCNRGELLPPIWLLLELAPSGSWGERHGADLRSGSCTFLRSVGGLLRMAVAWRESGERRSSWANRPGKR
ncbi:hypothetical protein U9M48_028916 [Paspalum notatum var. saurae]|uniref:Uncharacterized protein n=1 Tax=Paspalum notatum var. saurae TaxID=547442 RepID=A0AAQ3TY95_PASNO